MAPEHASSVQTSQGWLNDLMEPPEGIYTQDSRYDTQWIIQFSDDIDGAPLYYRNRANTRIMRWNGSSFVDDGGSPVALGANSRIILDGHGTPTNFAGFSPEELADLLLEHNIVADGDSIARISFLGCNLGQTPEAGGDYLSTGFATGFLGELDEAGVTVAEASVRNAYVHVDRFGRRWTVT